jgi:hypothetical protein
VRSMEDLFYLLWYRSDETCNESFILEYVRFDGLQIMAAGPPSLARKRQSRETGSRHWRVAMCLCLRSCDSLVDEEGLRGRVTSRVVWTWRWISCASWCHFNDTVALKRNKCVSFFGIPNWAGIHFLVCLVLEMVPRTAEANCLLSIAFLDSIQSLKRGEVQCVLWW